MTPKQHREELVALRKEFEQYYVTHAFNYAENPIGSRDCSVMWEGYQAGAASRDDEVATLRELKQIYQAERDQLREQVAMLREALENHQRQTRPIQQTIEALAATEPNIDTIAI